MRILLIGYSGCGKTSAADFIATKTGGKVANESDYIIASYAQHMGLDKDWVKENKYDLRDALFTHARAQQKIDPTYPVKLALDDGATIITGTRNPDELAAKREMYDIVVWVARPGYEAGPTDKLKPEDADVVISATNLKELEQEVEKLLA
jgi:dephospho-CoA kinase